MARAIRLNCSKEGSREETSHATKESGKVLKGEFPAEPEPRRRRLPKQIKDELYTDLPPVGVGGHSFAFKIPTPGIYRRAR
jgi:hypothetical protein